MNCSNLACAAPLPRGKLKCPECGQWNSDDAEQGRDGFEMIRLEDAQELDVTRIRTSVFDEVFGGGIVPGCSYLIGGAPGGGKSTLALQLAPLLVDGFGEARDVLYIASEEDAGRIKRRARRLLWSRPEVTNGLLFHHLLRHLVILNARGKSPLFCRGLGEWLTQYEQPIAAVILDSLSGLCEDDLRLQVEVAERMGKVASSRNIPVLLLSHINKDDELAGLKALEHKVDVTMSLFPIEEEAGIVGSKRKGEFPRVFRVHKNREGEAPKQMRLRMLEQGLVPEVHQKEDIQ